MACNTDCQAGKAEMVKGIRRLAFYRKQIVDQLQRERPADCYDLLHPRELRGSFEGVVVTYFIFPDWLYRFDEAGIFGLTVNINSYRHQRNRHIEDVDVVLGKFIGRDTCNALKEAFRYAKNETDIYPYFNFDLYPVFPFAPLGLNSTARGVLDKPGIKDTDSIIMFSPHLWSRDGKPGSFGYSGPGSE